jgi:hypothetical protein
MEITREVFDQQRRPRFGTANPERMRFAFWEWMIRGGEVPPADGQSCLEEIGLQMRDGVLKTVYGPYRARDLFGVPRNREDGPIWTFDRMGAIRLRLPDGRVVCIGGEHEDFYDPDFCIYNDVIVLKPDEEIEIYGYPKEVFPPTDFHTATLDRDRVVVIGGLGYKNDRRTGHTPVYELELAGYRISEIKTSGTMPGWISEHEASLDPNGIITIRRGQVLEHSEGKQRFRHNFEEYALDTRSWVWKRLTNRNWREFSIRQEKGAFIGEHKPKPEALFPRDIEHDVMPSKKREDARIVVEGVPVSLTISVVDIRIVVEGDMPEAWSIRLAEAIRANTEAVVHRRCILKSI